MLAGLVGMLFARWHLNTVRPMPRPFTRAILTAGSVDLHPLSLEELLHVPGRHRSGADYYKKHLFIRVLSHTLNKDGDGEPNILEQIVRSSSPEPFDLEDNVETLPKYSADRTPRSSGLTSKLSTKLKRPHRSEATGYDVENVDVTGSPTNGGYGSFYATYVCMFLPFLLFRVVMSVFFLRDKATRLTKPFANLCKSLRRAGE